MLSLHKKIFVLLFVITIQGCGFTPVYQEDIQSPDALAKPNIKESFLKIDVRPIAFGRAGQELQVHLENLLNPSGKEVTAEYLLSIDLKRRREALIIEQNREITRYNLVLTANYRLLNIDNAEVIYKGKSKMVESFDAIGSDFATFEAEENALRRITKEMAKDLRLRLVTYFLNKDSTSEDEASNNLDVK